MPPSEPEPTSLTESPGAVASVAGGVVCLCGSTRFRDEMLVAARAETLAGRIVVTPWVFSQAEAEAFGSEQVAALRALHRRKIDLAHEVLVVDVDGYVGEATAGEIAYAEGLGKPIRYWSRERPSGGRANVSPTAALLQAHRAQRLVTNRIPTLDVPDEVKELRCAVIEEEAAELRTAIEDDDIVEVADALGDLLNVVYGAALTFGIPIDEVFTEIHRSNMTKLDHDGEPILRADGKVLKGPNFSPPDLMPILLRHGYRR